MFRMFVAIVCLLAAVAGCGRSKSADETRPLLLFAAASMTEAVDEIAAAFEQDTGLEVEVSTASSSALAQQVSLGAPADVFISASREWTDFIEARGLAAEVRPFLSNSVVLTVPKDAPSPIRAPEDLLSDSVRALALADPDSVPAGKYGKEALQHLGLWDRLQLKVVPAADVRQALLLVERGEAEAGIVYATDAALSDAVRVVASLDAFLEEPVVYPAVLLKGEGDRVASERLYAFLFGPESTAILARYGFAPFTAEEPSS